MARRGKSRSGAVCLLNEAGVLTQSHLVGVNGVVVLVGIDGGQGGRHGKGDQRHGQRVGQNPGQLSQAGEERLGKSGEREESVVRLGIIRT